MYYDIDCYGAKALPLKYQITAHRPFMHGIYIAKTEFVTLLSTKVLNSLEKLSWLQRRPFHYEVPHNRAITVHATVSHTE